MRNSEGFPTFLAFVLNKKCCCLIYLKLIKEVNTLDEIKVNLGNIEKTHTLRYFRILKCSFTTVNSAGRSAPFKILKSLYFEFLEILYRLNLIF